MKKLILVLVLSVFVVGLGAGSAMADSIMFPWIVKSPTVLTLVSVVNTSETTDCAGGAKLHYQYYFKAETVPANLTGSCTVQSFERRTSMNDIVTFDASGAAAGGAALFNDQPPINGNVTYIPNEFDATSAPAAARAFLLVDNNNTNCFEDPWTASLYGEALVIQVSQGSAWGYIAFNGRGGGPDGPASEDDGLGFNDEIDMQGEVLRSPRYNDSAYNDDGLEVIPTVLLPLSTFKTKMFVTPVNFANWEYGSGPGARTPLANSRIQFCLDPAAAGNFPFVSPCWPESPDISVTNESCQSNGAPVCRSGGIYDNDEGPMNSSLQPNVVCTAALDISTPDLLLTQAQIDYMNNQPGGQAWTYVRSMLGSFWPQGQLGTRNVNTVADSIVGKLEYSDAPAGLVIDGTVVGGALNDFKWLRNSGSQLDGAFELDHGINAIGEENWED